VTSVGVAFAVFLMIFQSSLLIGFLKAAAKIIDSTDSDLWIAPRGVVCFDFSASLDGRFRDIAEGIPGVETVNRISVNFVGYQMPDGQHRIVVMIGADPNVGSLFPLPYLPHSRGALEPEAILVDETNTQELEVSAIPSEVEVSGLRAHISGVVRGFSSFLGSPYIFASYEDAARYSRIGEKRVAYLTVRIAKGYDVGTVKSMLASELPESPVVLVEVPVAPAQPVTPVSPEVVVLVVSAEPVVAEDSEPEVVETAPLLPPLPVSPEVALGLAEASPVVVFPVSPLAPEVAEVEVVQVPE